MADKLLLGETIVEHIAKINALIDKINNGGGGGTFEAIIDVEEFPTENINEDVFYRKLSGEFYYNGTPQADWNCHIVGSLPQEGEPVTTDMVHVVLYYAIDTGSVSGYVNSALSAALCAPVGWYPVETLGQAFGLAWGGIIWDAHEDPIDGSNRLLLSYSLYQYKRNWESINERIGWKGQGTGAVVFNTLQNKATGVTSLAEGVGTIASSISQHVQGEYNIEDSANRYAHIVGNGTKDNRSNAHTVGWDGVGWFASDVKIGGTSQYDENAASVLTTKDEHRFAKEASVWEKIYPVGAIYISTNSTSPASLFGGTWTQITDKFLLSAGSRYLAGSTGGSATHTHTISGYAHITCGTRASGGYAIMQDTIGSKVSYTKKRETTASSINVNYSPTTETVYTGTPITATNTSESNIPPYLVVYMWKRTA